MSKGTNSHNSAFIEVKELPQLHFVLMMKSCFVSIIPLSKQYLCTTLKNHLTLQEAPFAPFVLVIFSRMVLLL